VVDVGTELDTISREDEDDEAGRVRVVNVELGRTTDEEE
jgi:hypothetical protein